MVEFYLVIKTAAKSRTLLQLKGKMGTNASQSFSITDPRKTELFTAIFVYE